ncbi:hypothetical protein FRC06_002570, partial [Ceratobasidium sp. 370]
DLLQITTAMIAAAATSPPPQILSTVSSAHQIEPPTPNTTRNTRYMSTSPNPSPGDQRAMKRQAISREEVGGEPSDANLPSGSRNADPSNAQDTVYGFWHVDLDPAGRVPAGPVPGSVPPAPHHATDLQNWPIDFNFGVPPPGHEGQSAPYNPYQFGSTAPVGQPCHTQFGPPSANVVTSVQPSPSQAQTSQHFVNPVPAHQFSASSSANPHPYNSSAAVGFSGVTAQPYTSVGTMLQGGATPPVLDCPYLFGLLQRDRASRLSLTPSELNLELGGPRYNNKWGNWEKQYVIVFNVGPGAPQERVNVALKTTRRSMKIGEVPAQWFELSNTLFRGHRKPSTLIQTWWSLFDTYCWILSVCPGPTNQPTAYYLDRVCREFNSNPAAAAAKFSVMPEQLAPFIVGGWFSMFHNRIADTDIVNSKVHLCRTSPTNENPTSTPTSSSARSHAGARSASARPTNTHSTSARSTSAHSTSVHSAGAHSSNPQSGGVSRSAVFSPPRAALVPAAHTPAAPPSVAASALVEEFERSETQDDANLEFLQVPGVALQKLPGVWEMVRNVKAVSEAAIRLADAKVEYLRAAADEARAKAIKTLVEMDREKVDAKARVAVTVISAGAVPADLRRTYENMLGDLSTLHRTEVNTDEVLRVLRQYLPGPRHTLTELVSGIDDARVKATVRELADDISRLDDAPGASN